MSEPSYFPKDGDYASLIDELGQQQLREIEKQRLQSIAEHQKHSQQAPASYARLKPLHSDSLKMDTIQYQNAAEQDRQVFGKNSASLKNSRITDNPKQSTVKVNSQPFSGRTQPAAGTAGEREGNMRTFRTISFFIILASSFVLSEFDIDEDLTVFLVVIIIFFLIAVFSSFRRK